MANNRPALWWQSAPVIKDGKVRCVANAASGEETTDWFSLAEIVAHLTKRAPDLATPCENHILYVACGYKYCPNCGNPLGG